MTPRDRIMRSLGWLLVSRGGMQTVTFLSTLVAMRLLRPEDYGVIALAAVWVTTLLGLVQLGLGPAIVQYRDLAEGDLNACFWLTLALATLAYAGLYAAAPAIGAWFESPPLPGVLRFTGLAIPIATVRLVPENLLRKRLRLDRVSQAEILGSAVTVAAVLGLAWSGAGVWALATGAVVMQVAQTTLAFLFARWRPGTAGGGGHVIELLRFGRATLAGGVCWMVYVHADMFVLGKVAGDAAVGLYAMARQLTVVVAEKVSTLVNQIATPLMATQQDDVPGLARSLFRGLRCVAWLTFPMSAGMVLVGDLLVGIALTAKWNAALPLLYVFAFYGAVESLAILLPPVLSARYRVGLLFRFHLALMLVMPAAFWVGATMAGAMGIALAWALLYPAFTVVLAGLTLAEVGAGWRTLGGELARPLAATALMAAAVALVRWSLTAGQAEPVTVFAACILTGVVTYAAAVLAFGGHVRTDLLELLAWFGRRRVAVAGGES
jgi:O-antigen/teichoic acid export membrane protein